MKRILNEPPTKLLPSRLAVIGECPGQFEDLMDSPFVGPSGKLLWAALQENDIPRSACLVGNICQVRPPADNILRLSWTGLEIQDGLARLKQDVEDSDPNCILLLGRLAVKAAGIDLPEKPSKLEPRTMTKMRGSIFRCTDMDSPFYDRKCVISLHPANILRNYDQQPLFRFDVARAVKEALTPTCILPPDTATIKVDLSFPAAMEELYKIQPGCVVAVDIEGGCDVGITCIGFATSPSYGFSVDPRRFAGDQKLAVWREISRICTDATIGKILQNAPYDTFVLAYVYKIALLGVIWDTMMSGPEIYPELPKGLDTQASIWTRWPYYKFERKIGDGVVLQTYNVKDCLTTYDIANSHRQLLSSLPQPYTQANADHVQFNLSLLPFFNYITLKGIRYNTQLKDDKIQQLKVQQDEVQSIINSLHGAPLNPASPKQINDALYKVRRLPSIYKKEAGKNTDRETSDVNALLRLLINHNDDLVYNILRWRAIEGVRKQLVGCDPDGRMRTSYSNPGTKTHRVACHTSNTGNGLNLQTITYENRILYQADPGFYFGQCDLSGADAWTVAAWCSSLGDDNMLNDFRAGLKPAQVIVALWEYGDEILNYSSERMREPVGQAKADLNADSTWDWKYFAAKRIQHGTNYKMGEITMSRLILADSWKKNHNPVHLRSTICKQLQQLYLRRYPGILRWWRHLQEHVRANSCIHTSAGPHVIFTNPYADVSFGEICSHEPQTNTTYATNRAALNLWSDPENRQPDGSLIIQPLHQVHDALCLQFPVDVLDFAQRKIRDYFSTPIEIAGIPLTIPYEGNYGLNWLELGPQYGGGTL